MRWLVLLAAVATAAAVLVARGRSVSDGTRALPTTPTSARLATVRRVVDGDTIVLGGVGRGGLVGVDTPEFHGRAECYGREASAFARRTLDRRPVRYTLGVDSTDRYGHALVYVWLPDGRSFNALLVARGYATPLTIPPNVDYADAFVGLAREARERRRGLWAPGAC